MKLAPVESKCFMHKEKFKQRTTGWFDSYLVSQPVITRAEDLDEN